PRGAALLTGPGGTGEPGGGPTGPTPCAQAARDLGGAPAARGGGAAAPAAEPGRGDRGGGAGSAARSPRLAGGRLPGPGAAGRDRRREIRDAREPALDRPRETLRGAAAVERCTERVGLHQRHRHPLAVDRVEAARRVAERDEPDRPARGALEVDAAARPEPV